jgi:hypothetical protein
MKKPKHKPQYIKQTFKLRDDHTWKAPPGHVIVMLERGVVSFNMPQSWKVTDHEPFTVRDAQPPDDKAGMQISYWKFKPGIDWTGLPLAPLLKESTRTKKGEVLSTSDIFTHPRTDIEIVWLEQRFIDPAEKREAFSRIGMARGFNVHVLMTFSYWVEDEKDMIPFWDEVLHSLQLGRVIQDPLKGETLH